MLLKYATPCAVSLVFNALYNIIDQVFISRGVGYLGNGATNVIFPLIIFSLAVTSMIGAGSAAYFSLHLGRGEKERCSVAVGNATLLCIVFGILYMAATLIFLEPLCCLFGATDEMLPYALEYGWIIAIGFPFSAIDVVLDALVRADGSPRFSMIGLLCGCAVNLILDPVLIFGFGMDMTGAAIATICGEILNALFLLGYLFRFKTIPLKRADFKLAFSCCKQFLIFGFSSFLLQFSYLLQVSISNNLLVHYGELSKYGPDIPLTAMGVTMKVSQIVIYLVMGVANGAQPIIGYNYGARLYPRVKKTFRLMMIISLCITIISMIGFQVFPAEIMSVFGEDDPLYIEFSIKCFRIFLMAVILMGFQMSIGFFFQSVGKAKLATAATMSRQLVLMLAAMIVLPIFLGVEGVLWAGPVADVLAFLFTVVLLLLNWKKIFTPGELSAQLP
ncbi:MAG: MATE family efflux transporter [Oscillospiraceae bacterium]|nr:MATE family efflux transporter [Oscillospiraceae bacterium]